jgi:hypothetical protein
MIAALFAYRLSAYFQNNLSLAILSFRRQVAYQHLSFHFIGQNCDDKYLVIVNIVIVLDALRKKTQFDV